MFWGIRLVACVAMPDAPPAWLAPFDGQTQVTADFVPLIDIALEQPEGWPLDRDLLRVVDLTTGEPVTGVVQADATTVWFAADRPWALDRDYAWSIDAPEEQPRGPSVAFPPILVGTSSFSTRTELELLAAGVREGLVCAVWSRPVEPAELAAWVPTIGLDPPGEWSVLDIDDPAEERGLVGPAVSCVLGTGGPLRVAQGEAVQSVEVSSTDPEDLVKELRRWSP